MSKKTLYILRKRRGEQQKGCLPLVMRMRTTSSTTRLRPTVPRVRRTRTRGVTGRPRTRSAGPTPATWQHCTRRISWITQTRARSVPWCLTQVRETPWITQTRARSVPWCLTHVKEASWIRTRRARLAPWFRTQFFVHLHSCLTRQISLLVLYNLAWNS